MNWLKIGDPQIRLDVLTHCIETVKCLITFDTFSWLCGPAVMYLNAVLEVQGSILDFVKDVWSYVWVFCLFFVYNTLFVTKLGNSFCNVN